MDKQFMLIFLLIYVQYWQKAVLSFEKGSNRQNHSSSGFLHPVKNSPSKNYDSPQPLNAIWKTSIYKTLWPLFVYGVQLLQGYTEPLWGGSLLFTRNPLYSLNQSRKDERRRWPWSHPVVLNLCIYLFITKYKLKSQYEFSVLPGRLIQNMFSLDIYIDQMIIQ